MRNKGSLTLVAQPQAYFYELVCESLGKHQVSTSPETEVYLVNLLEKFMTTESLKNDPLALMIKEALEEPRREEQRRLFRQVGDLSLYVAGYFQDSLNRKLVDVDYYIDMGGTAYRQVAARIDESFQRQVFGELAEKFGSLVDVLAGISDKTHPKSEKDLLRLYELWVRTRSERAAKALQEAGIVPNDTLKKDWQ